VSSLIFSIVAMLTAIFLSWERALIFPILALVALSFVAGLLSRLFTCRQIVKAPSRKPAFIGILLSCLALCLCKMLDPDIGFYLECRIEDIRRSVIRHLDPVEEALEHGHVIFCEALSCVEPAEIGPAQLFDVLPRSILYSNSTAFLRAAVKVGRLSSIWEKGGNYLLP
jgi:hypothetical protein